MTNNTAFNEMMVHIPLCTHKEASKVLIIGNKTNELEIQTNKHSKTSKFEFIDIKSFLTCSSKDIDVAILLEDEFEEKILEKIENVLNKDGLFCFKSKSFIENKEKLFSDLKLAGTKFWISIPFKFDHNTSIIASKKYHPTADINLNRADLLDDLKYYSSEIHIASFVYPKSEHDALTGVAKR